MTVVLSNVRAGVCTGPGPCDATPLGEGKNWVTHTDPVEGLGPYVHAIAHALKREKGMSESQSIATAIAAIKSWAAGGGKVSEATRARARAAVAHWEKLKAKAHTGARSVDQDNTAYRLGIHDRTNGKAKLTAKAYHEAHPGADADDYPLYEAGYEADRDDLDLKLVPKSTERRALDAIASLDVAIHMRDAMGGVAEWGPIGPPGLDVSGSGSLLPVTNARKPKPREAKLVTEEIEHHRFKGSNLTACTQCGRPVSAEVHKRPKA